MSAFHDVILAGASGSQGYQISRSVRLRSSASAYFNRTPASAGNRQKFTWSGWVKRGSLGVSGALFSRDQNGSGQAWAQFNFNGSDQLNFINYSTVTDNVKTTTRVFRDPSAWYHLVLVFDSTNATAADRIQIWVNGVRETSFVTSTDPSLNYNSYINESGQQHNIGSVLVSSRTNYFDGYLTEVNFIDGQALTPSSFGETDTITGVWKPKRYTGTYGTNGFYLNFSDNSNNTAATIGKDYSGNGNNWTPNNISVTSGVTYDSMLDVPTQWADGGNGRGNYAVWNPVEPNAALGGAIVDGNLLGYPANTAGTGQLKATINFPTSGKFYFEVTPTVITSATTIIGILRSTIAVGTAPASSGDMYAYQSDGNKWNGSATTSYGATYTTNDVIGVAFDIDAGTITFYKNGSTQGQAYSGISGEYVAAVRDGTTGGVTQYAVNFGQRPFAYTPPTGFKALNTQNLPDSTIKKGNQYFNAVTWTGDGVDGRTITGVGFNPDLVWAKGRSNTGAHVLADAVRGTNANLYTNLTDAETNPTTGASGGGIGSVTTDGFVLEQGSTNMDLVNTSSRTYVAWQWKESATAGFDIVTFTNPSSGSSSFAHNLGVKPSMIIVKSRSNTSNWTTMHKSLGTNMADNWINLESTAAKQTSTNIWGGEPTSSVFFCGTGIQVAGATMVAYLFAEVAGFSRFGSYTGNGSTDGPFVYCGFRPAFIMAKDASVTNSWVMYDLRRDPYNVSQNYLIPNSSGAEGVSTSLDITANGFKIRTTGPGALNTSGSTVIFAAFAENPFKNSLAR